MICEGKNLTASGWRKEGGGFPEMKMASLLILWSLPLLHAGGQGQFPCPGCTAGVSHAGAHVAWLVIQQTRDISFPDDPSGGGLSSSLEDEEESLEDGAFANGVLLPRSLRDPGRGDLSSLAHGQHDLLRIPSCPHPLRC
jgi:hypothetical protein